MSETRKLEFKYAQIRKSTRQCKGVFTSEEPVSANFLYEYVEIPTLNGAYIDKYYIDGAWYEDAEGAIPWSPEE